MLAILGSIFSVQWGAAIAKGLIPSIGVIGASGIRVALAAILLLAVFRPPLHRFTWPQWRAVLLYGITIGVMNTLFYEALARIPLGLAVTLEFIGPLGVAIAGSRRALDLVWVVLAAAGIALITPWHPGSTIDPLGVVYALLTGGCWAAYIVIGARVSKLLTIGVAVATGMSIASIAVLPFALASGGLARLRPDLYGAALAVAILSSALPYTLEMYPLGALPARTFGILMSLEPAVAALTGLVLLRERLTIAQWTAVGLVLTASIGTVLTARQASPGSDG
jgi:inner membrane transporter RhtA